MQKLFRRLTLCSIRLEVHKSEPQHHAQIDLYADRTAITKSYHIYLVYIILSTSLTLQTPLHSEVTFEMMTLGGLTDMDPLQDIVVASPFAQAMIQSLLTVRVLDRRPPTEQVSVRMTQTH